jgi:hypothetical protein
VINEVEIALEQLRGGEIGFVAGAACQQQQKEGDYHTLRNKFSQFGKFPKPLEHDTSPSDFIVRTYVFCL